MEFIMLAGVIAICLTICYIADRYFDYKETIKKEDEKDD